MDPLRDLIKNYAIKKDRFIKSVCEPLKILLNIPIFSYFRIEPDGRFGNLSNFPEELDFFYDQNFHIDYPYLIHPSLLRSGCVFTTVARDPLQSNKIFNKYEMYHLLIILQHDGESVEGFVFSPTGKDSQSCSYLLSRLDMLYKFIAYFKKRCSGLLKNMMGDGFNLKEAKKERFLIVDPSVQLANRDPLIQRFLNLVCPLSKRERQCLELFKQGHSAQSTAAILRLPIRTIEHYIDNIKDKLGCSSKWELLGW